jgi:hypothetical protein
MRIALHCTATQINESVSLVERIMFSLTPLLTPTAAMAWMALFTIGTLARAPRRASILNFAA